LQLSCRHPRGHFGIARSVRLSVKWRSCLGYKHAGCLQLSHRRPLETCGLRTRSQTDVDPPRFLDRAAIGRGISSHRPRGDTLFLIKNMQLFPGPYNIPGPRLHCTLPLLDAAARDFNMRASFAHFRAAVPVGLIERTAVQRRKAVPCSQLRRGARCVDRDRSALLWRDDDATANAVNWDL